MQAYYPFDVYGQLNDNDNLSFCLPLDHSFLLPVCVLVYVLLPLQLLFSPYPQSCPFALLFLFTAFLRLILLLAVRDHLFACLVFFLTLLSILLNKVLAD